MKSKYMNINRIEFVVTNECTGSCKHCQSGSDINKKCSHKHIISEHAVDVIEKLSSVFNITSVMTFGGEPLIYSDVVSNIHAKATECNIDIRQIITNGFFTKDKNVSRKVAHELCDAGVNNLLISVDGLHQEAIPIEPVYQFIIDVIDAKIPNAFLYPAWVVNKNHSNQYNKKTKKVLMKFSDLPIPIKDNIIDLTGSAAKFLYEYYDIYPLNPEDSLLSERCTGPANVTNISINPNGDIVGCAGIIGNIYNEDILDIVKNYNPYEIESMSAIMNGGIAELLDLANKQGIPFDITKYYTACWDACNAITKCLHAKNA